MGKVKKWQECGRNKIKGARRVRMGENLRDDGL